MYGDEAPGGFSPQGLAQIPATLQGVVDQGSLSGAVTLLWRKGEVAQVNTIRSPSGFPSSARCRC